MSGRAHKTTLTIYRDILRCIRHNAAQSQKAKTARAMVRKEFEKNRYTTTPEEIDLQRQRGLNGIKNYLYVYSMLQSNPEALQRQYTTDTPSNQAVGNTGDLHASEIVGFAKLLDEYQKEFDDTSKVKVNMTQNIQNNPPK